MIKSTSGDGPTPCPGRRKTLRKDSGVICRTDGPSCLARSRVMVWGTRKRFTCRRMTYHQGGQHTHGGGLKGGGGGLGKRGRGGEE